MLPVSLCCFSNLITKLLATPNLLAQGECPDRRLATTGDATASRVSVKLIHSDKHQQFFVLDPLNTLSLFCLFI